ncbi:hypothetical protein GDO81_021909 [Engystomops pustulosus]|uniref:Uncharacterized protein n=1 Tax=Engystomops pustulosus TaxID=76066 RepID=A0AAV6ZPR2_ENGPU|nr:hypothetical protein GDO81_021909 [Engystomops pustulosus]
MGRRVRRLGLYFTPLFLPPRVLRNGVRRRQLRCIWLYRLVTRYLMRFLQYFAVCIRRRQWDISTSISGILKLL